MIQIDIDMPKTCDDCPFHVYHSGRDYVCVATPLFYPMNLANYKGGRKDFCPLKEVSQEPILEKISTEIADIYCGQYCENPLTAGAMKEMALDIIDKYKVNREKT